MFIESAKSRSVVAWLFGVWKDCRFKPQDQIKDCKIGICYFSAKYVGTKEQGVRSKKFEDSKGLIRIRKFKKDRQHNGLKEKYKKTRIYQTLHIKPVTRTA